MQVGVLSVLLCMVVTLVSGNHQWKSFRWNISDTSWDHTSDGRLVVYVRSVMNEELTSVLSEVMDHWNTLYSSVRKEQVIQHNHAVFLTQWHSGKPVMVEAESADYGRTGWLGLATVWHRAGVVALARTQLNTRYRLNEDGIRHVLCQELGHTLGLDHVDEDWYNTPLHTCMDYQSHRWPVPNQHDFDELDRIYGRKAEDHTDTTINIPTQQPSISPSMNLESGNPTSSPQKSTTEDICLDTADSYLCLLLCQFGMCGSEISQSCCQTCSEHSQDCSPSANTAAQMGTAKKNSDSLSEQFGSVVVSGENELIFDKHATPLSDAAHHRHHPSHEEVSALHFDENGQTSEEGFQMDKKDEWLHMTTHLLLVRPEEDT